jgi:hypothetical protein
MIKVFQFSSSASLERLTGRTAFNLEELLDLMRTCSKTSIFYHTFSAFMKLREVHAPFNNDFAVWVAGMLNEKALAERLTAVDLSEYNTLEKLRNRLVYLIQSHIEENPLCCKKIADEPFYLHDVTRVVYLTDHFAYDLASFREMLTRISIYSIYFHFIESRLQSKIKTDDFSVWIEEALNMPSLAQKIRAIDISVSDLEGLRSRIIRLIDESSRIQADDARIDR